MKFVSTRIAAPLLAIAVAGLLPQAASAHSIAGRVVVSKPDSTVVKVHKRRWHDGRYWRRSSDHVVVDAPTTYVETRRGRVWVDAPFTAVRVHPRGVWVRAPFVDLYVPR
jgi:hypothetical protein